MSIVDANHIARMHGTAALRRTLDAGSAPPPNCSANGAVPVVEFTAAMELIAGIITDPSLAKLATAKGLIDEHFERGTGLRGAFRFAIEGPKRVQQALSSGCGGLTHEMVRRLYALNLSVSHDRAEVLIRQIIAIAAATTYTKADEPNEDQEQPPLEDGSDAEKIVAGKTTKGAKQGPTEPPRAHGAAHSWDDPDWSILDDRRGGLPSFPLDTLSASARDWVQRAAHGAGVTPDHVAVPMLGIMSSLIGTARRVLASRSWSQPLTCWAAVVGLSGTGKTPGIDATKRPLAQIERDTKTKVADLRRAHETRVEVAKAERAKWKKAVEDARQAGNSAPPIPAAAVDPGPFVAPRLHVSDGTIERFAELLQARPQGMLRLSDELAALFMNMGRYSGGQDNEFWLEAWNGQPYVVERMGRSLSVDHLLIGVVGGLQPDKLARSFQGDLDGMYARILFAWPPESNYQALTDDVAEVEPEIINALQRIIGLAELMDGKLVVRSTPLSPEAKEEFEQCRQFLHAGKDGLDGREREWWAKTPAHVLRLAGTLAYVTWAFTSEAEPPQVELTFVNAAVRLVRDYFWPHARAALRQIGRSERHANARRALRWIKAYKKTEVSVMDIRRDALSQSLDADQTHSLLEGLVKAGWLRPRAELTGGRSKRRWDVNPKLFFSRDA
jgi:hypothetical protein